MYAVCVCVVVLCRCARLLGECASSAICCVLFYGLCCIVLLWLNVLSMSICDSVARYCVVCLYGVFVCVCLCDCACLKVSVCVLLCDLVCDVVWFVVLRFV